MGRLHIQGKHWRRLLLGAFVLYLYGALGYLGQAHSHEPVSSHPDCQLCHIASQPALAEAPPSPAAPLVVFSAFSCDETRPLLAPRHGTASPRAPPSA